MTRTTAIKNTNVRPLYTNLGAGKPVWITNWFKNAGVITWESNILSHPPAFAMYLIVFLVYFVNFTSLSLYNLQIIFSLRRRYMYSANLQRLESVFKEKHGVWDPMSKLTLTHILNSVVSYPPPIQRERGGEGKSSPIGWAHLYLSANFQDNRKETGQYGEGGGKGWDLTLCLWVDILWSLGNPLPELSLTQRHRWL